MFIFPFSGEYTFGAGILFFPISYLFNDIFDRGLRFTHVQRRVGTGQVLALSFLRRSCRSLLRRFQLAPSMSPEHPAGRQFYFWAKQDVSHSRHWSAFLGGGEFI
jgi:hypothetical protein